MKQIIEQSIVSAIDNLIKIGKLPSVTKDIAIEIERCKNPAHGDFASNIALKLAKPTQSNPRVIANTLLEAIASDDFEKIDIAGPGFINFTLTKKRYATLISTILANKDKFGLQPIDNSQKILIEFVSANPTGPLHVGHGRGAAYGATLANVMRAAGYVVDCEYYVNDAGRQMDILAISVYLRYLMLGGLEFNYPENAYQANYISDIAQSIFTEFGDKYIASADAIFSALPEDKEKRIDLIIARSKAHLVDDYAIFFDAALNTILDDIKEDLAEFGVHFQQFFSEKSLYSEDKIKTAIDTLKANQHIYEKDNALWFKATEFGDDKDRVVQRENGIYTYFASDIAYHHDKLLRGYGKLIDIFGADHHGYMGRVKASLKALGQNPEQLQIELVQFAVLYKDGEKMQMSTRSGQYVTLRELRNMVGNSAARFFYVMRKPSQHLDFDLDLAQKHNKDNPLYYIQYAHARIHRLYEKLDDLTVENNLEQQVGALTLAQEIDILRLLEQYEDTIVLAAKDYAPHYLANYLKELASAVHSYYDASQVKFIEADTLQATRLALLLASKQVLKNGLNLLGVDAPEKM